MNPQMTKKIGNVNTVAWIFIFLMVMAGCRTNNQPDIKYAEVKRGEFSIEITEEGEVEATSAVNISSPNISWRFGMLKITYIVEDGAQVSEGDTVIEFDPSDVQKAIIDAKANLDIEKANLAKQMSQNESQLEDLKADLKIKEIAYKISEINLEQAVYESDITKREIRLNLDRAEIELEKARQEIENRKSIQHEEIQKIKLRIQQLQAELDDAYETLNSLLVTSPASGIAIILENRRTDTKWQVGDQPWSGNPLINLPDMSELKAEVEINEVDISKIRTGQSVDIRLDAQTDSSFSGKVTSIANLARYKKRGSNIKVFPVEILIEGTSEKMLPGITVSCNIIIDRIDDVLFVPLEAVFQDEQGDYVFLKNGASYEKTSIKTGRRNADYVIVENGLKRKDKVALSMPFEEEEGEEEEEDQLGQLYP